MKKGYVYIGIVFVLFAYCAVAAGTPDITDYNNSIDTNNLYPVVSYNGNIQFYAIANESITLWVWHIDGVNQSHNYDNLTAAWAAKGYKTVNVTATNTNGTTLPITWNPYVKMEMGGAGDTITDMDEAGYDNLMAGLEGDSPDFELVLWAVTEPYQTVVGNVFFLILFGLPMMMFYLRQNSLIIPATFGIILGVVLFNFLPSSFAATASAIVVMSILGTLFSFYKERR